MLGDLATGTMKRWPAFECDDSYSCGLSREEQRMLGKKPKESAPGVASQRRS